MFLLITKFYYDGDILLWFEGPNCSISDCITPKKPVAMAEHLTQPERISEPKENKPAISKKAPVASDSPEATADTPKGYFSTDFIINVVNDHCVTG